MSPLGYTVVKQHPYRDNRSLRGTLHDTIVTSSGVRRRRPDPPAALIATAGAGKSPADHATARAAIAEVTATD